jgi:hypothetical protein
MMRRMKLMLEEITVDSFATLRAGTRPGTVLGHESDDDDDPPFNTVGNIPTCEPCDASNQATCDTCQGPNCTNDCPAVG